MSRFTAVDLSQLAPPTLIDPLDYETILAEIKADFLAKWDALRLEQPDLPVIDTLMLDSDLLAIFLQVLTYRELTLRALINDKARAVLLAFATGVDLDQIGAMFGVQRAVVDPGDAQTPPTMEPDDRFRRRIQLAPEAFSTVGPRGAYEFHALTVAPALADAHAYSPADGRVTVVLSGPNGADADQADIAAIIGKFSREDTVPLTDIVTVQRAARVTYDVSMTLLVPRGPDPALIAQVAEASVRRYAAERCAISTEVYKAGLYAAAKVGGVENVIILSPTDDIVCNDVQVPVLGELTITTAVL